MNKYEAIINNLIQWGTSSDKLYAAMLLGSQSRAVHGADEYSDLDIIIIVGDPDYFLTTDQWLDAIGKHHISFSEDSVEGCTARRILFDGALDVDFIIAPRSIINTGFTETASYLFERGRRILIDKIGLQQVMPPPNQAKQTRTPLSENDFITIVNDFWYHAVWTVKKLKRGELWTAKSCLDFYMKGKLLTMIEQHARTIHGADYDTWYSGRFIEEWAEPWIIERLAACFSHYDKEDIKTALTRTMELFRAVSAETAANSSFKYPDEADAYAAEWVTSML